MSLDLSWSLLDDAFSAQLLLTLDKALSNASKPDFIGPIHLSALQLGHEAPEANIVDIGDVWQDFLVREEVSVPKENQEYSKSSGLSDSQKGRGVAPSSSSHQDHFAQFAERNLPFTAGPPSLAAKGKRGSQRKRANRLQTYRQYSDSGQAHLVDSGSQTSYDPTASIPQTPASSHWGAGLLPVDRPFSSQRSSAGGYFSAWQAAAGQPPLHRTASAPHRPPTWRRSSSLALPQNTSMQTTPLSYPEPEADSERPVSSSLPSLQLHLYLHWNTSSIRVTVNTSLLINHPSPAFMSLPLCITITGLTLQAGGLLAFDVDPVTNVRRGHFCLVEEEEREEASNGDGGTEEELEGSKQAGPDEVLSSVDGERNKSAGTSLPPLRTKATTTTGRGPSFGMEDHRTLGERILSNVTLETSVGQADKHVLRNVAKVERFVVSLVRKAIGDELVYPNFYSIELP